VIKFIKKIFFNNILLKLSAVLIAFVIWIIVVNIENNKIIMTYFLKPELLNKEELSEKKIVLLDEKKVKDSVVEVKIQAARNDFKFINKNLKAILNFSNIASTDVNNIDVHILFSEYIDRNSYRVLKIYPEKIEINLDNLVNREEKVYYELKNKPADGFYLKNIKIIPELVNISGAKSLLDNLSPLNLILDVYNLKKDTSRSEIIKLFDKEKNDISDNFTLSDKEIKFEIEVDSYKKINIEKPKLMGNINDNYLLKNIDYEPKQIEIIGENKDLIDTLKIFEIDVDGACLSKTIEFNIGELLPKGIFLKPDSNNDKLLISIEIEKKSE
jgi:YbbR domain-containing protein